MATIPENTDNTKMEESGGLEEDHAKALILIQSMIRRALAVRRAREKLLDVFEKVYDAEHGAFYYHNKHTGESQWTKPVLLSEKGDIPLTPRSRARALEEGLITEDERLAAVEQHEEGKEDFKVGEEDFKVGEEDFKVGKEDFKVGEEEEAEEEEADEKSEVVRVEHDLSRPEYAGALRVIRSEFELRKMLEAHGLDRFAGLMEEEGFSDPEALLAMTDKDMESLGLRRGHRRVLHRALQGLRDRLEQAGVPASALTADDDVNVDPGSRAGRRRTQRRSSISGAVRQRGARRREAVEEEVDGTVDKEDATELAGSARRRERQEMADEARRIRLAKALDAGEPMPEAPQNPSLLTKSSARSRASSPGNMASARSLHTGRSTAESRQSTRREAAAKEAYATAAAAARSDEIVLEILFDGEEGESPIEGDLVRVHYTCSLPDGTVVESSRDRGRAFQFRLGAGQVVRGWEHAIPQLTRGTRARFRVPPSLAYGKLGRPPKIPPETPLDFEVQLIDFFEPDLDLSPNEDEDDYDEEDEDDGF